MSNYKLQLQDDVWCYNQQPVLKNHKALNPHIILDIDQETLDHYYPELGVEYPQKLTYDFELTRKGVNASLAKGNEMLNANDRMHPIVKSQITNHLRNIGREAVTEVPVQFSPENPCNLTITVFPPTNRRMDTPNIYPTVKALLDGMTDAGLWTDDNDEVIKTFTFKKGEKVKTGKYLIRIEIEPEV